MPTVSAAEVRSARSFLRSRLHAGTGDIPPRQFAAAAKEQGMGFQELATTLARLYGAGTNEHFYREQALEQAVAGGGS